MFEITRNSGFRITFGNGLTLSVQFNPLANYITNRDYFNKENVDLRNLSVIDASKNRQPDAEIAVFDKVGRFVTKDFFPNLGDDVKGYVTPDELADLIHKIKNYGNTDIEIA